ncbi:MAG: flagellar M-ring protein FliF [Clostridia bacterium]|nr:flagellar M-ring protein FliF [Clostridia bacterium]
MNLNGLLIRFNRWWTNLSPTKKIVYPALLGVALVAIVVGTQRLTRVEYAPLFGNLDPQSASAIVEKLKQDKVPYQLADNGATIMVPKDQVYDLRLQMAGSGLVAGGGGKGFELFDQNQLGLSDFQQQVDYQRALQVELQRTIGWMDQVDQARVHITMAQPSLYSQQEKPAQAVVSLRLKPMAKLSPEQVKSIVYLVSGAVDNLPPENVKVIDTRGEVLSDLILADLSSSSSSPSTGVQQELKRNFERDLEKRITQVLDQVLGPNKAAVMVSANLDFSQHEVTRIEYGPNNVLRSEQVIQEQTTGAGPTGGIPGTPSNVGNYPIPQTGGQQGSNRSQTTRNYEVTQNQDRIVYAPGRLQNLSASVVLDGALPPQTISQVQNLVAAAIGFQQARGDQINVTSIPFDRSWEQQQQQEMQQAAQDEARRQALKRYITLGAIGLVALLLVVGTLIWLRRRSQAVPELAGAELAGVPVAATGDVAPIELAPEQQKERDRQEKVRESIRKQPDQAAQLLRTWVAEDRT